MSWSGVVVQRISALTSAPDTPALSRATRAASVARVPVVPRPLSGGSFGGGGSTNGPVAARRSRIPLRSKIQSSLVSNRVVRSSLETTVGGRALPHPLTATPVKGGPRAGAQRRFGRSCRVQPGDGLTCLHTLSGLRQEPLQGAGEGGQDRLVADAAKHRADFHRRARLVRTVGCGLEDAGGG